MNGFKLNVVNCLVAISLVIVSLVVPVVAANLVQMPQTDQVESVQQDGAGHDATP